MSEELPVVAGRRRSRGVEATARASALKRLTTLRIGGHRSTEAANGGFQVKMNDLIYDTVDEDEYEAIVAKRLESVKEFIFDGEVAGDLLPNCCWFHLSIDYGATWKLVQLDSQFGFLHSSRAVLDLCAAPGGWMQVVVERVPVGSLVVGVDLDSIRPIRCAIAFQQDITTTKCRSTVKKLMAEHGSRAFDLVLHDGSPNVGGSWAIVGKKKRHKVQLV